MKTKTIDPITREALKKIQVALKEITKLHSNEARAAWKANRKAVSANDLRESTRLDEVASRHEGVFESLTYAIKDIQDALSR